MRLQRALGHRPDARTYIVVGQGRRQDEFDAVFLACGAQNVQRIEVGRHVAVGWIDHRGAAVQDRVTAKQQAVFEQNKAQAGGSVARRVQHL